MTRVEVAGQGDVLAWTLNRRMDSRLHIRFMPVVGGLLDGGMGCGIVGAPGLRGKFAYDLRRGIGDFGRYECPLCPFLRGASGHGD